MKYKRFYTYSKLIFALSLLLGFSLTTESLKAKAADLPFMSDTTRVTCGESSAYSNWIDNERLALIFMFPSDSLVVTPNVEVNFMFDNLCSDTVRHFLEIFDRGVDTLKFSKTAVLIVNDDVAPVFSSTVADTVKLSCNGVIPDTSTVSVMDNCGLDTVRYSVNMNSGGNCAINDTIRRTWEAVDICGNVANYQQTIIIIDDQRPIFLSLPPLFDTVSCLAEADTAFTGVPVAFDSCDADVDITFIDQPTNLPNIPQACNNKRTIIRLWFITDDCSNANTYVQTIYVNDTIPPSYIAPRDTTISCEFGDDPFFTGVPVFIQNDCDSLTSNNYTFQDKVTSGSCDNEFDVERTWFVFDNCGNIDTAIQQIQIRDDTPPEFVQVPQDLTINCTFGLDLDSVFNRWLETNGNAIASDICTPDSLLTWEAFISGTNTPASFPMSTCQNGDDIIYQQRVAFAVTDICGNTDSVSGDFIVVDNLPPVIENCPGDSIISTVIDACLGDYTIYRPMITDECSQDSMTFPGLSFSYRINDDPLVEVSGDSVEIQLPLGMNKLTYVATDCGGNQDSCSFMVNVIDDVPPILVCPNDTMISINNGSCIANFMLPLPAASDNCGIDSSFMGPRPIYYSEGATTLSPTKMTMAGAPTHSFEVGITTIYYIIEDESGNRDTCNFQLEVVDTEDPVARCQPTTLFINPSGLDIQNINVGDVDAGSTDNCSIDSLYLTPNLFDCGNQVGRVEDIVLTVEDVSGNISRCTTFVRIENLEPQPTANSGLCGNDTLFLNANPPPAQGGTVYTYFWTGPNGFTSTRANPVIPNISGINAGSYTVEITGLTGCISSGSVEVAIEDLPTTPELIAEDNYCLNSFITLQSSVAPEGAQVIYRWYRGNPPSGILLAETIVPSFSFQATSITASGEYYVEIEADACFSQPSLPKRIIINEFPIAIPQDTVITVCSGETITLGTPVIGSGVTYQWTGPNGYNEMGQFPRIIENARIANDGVYSLVVSRNGCLSAPAFVRVNVIQSPAQPMLSNSGPVCEGESVSLSTNAQATIYHWIAPDLREFSTSTNTFVLDNADKSIDGEWQLYVTDFNCDSEVSIPSDLVVNDLPNTVAASSPDIICEGSTLSLNASPNIANASYAWSGPDDFLGAGRNVSIDNVRPVKSGEYSVTITTEAGCSQSAEINVEVKASVQIIAATNDGPACLLGPTDIQLNAAVFPTDDGSYRYSWMGPNGYVSNVREAIIPNATATNNGNYQLIVTNGEGCISEAEITVVDVNDPPLTPSIPLISDITPQPLCAGSPVRLLADDYLGTQVNYHWQTPNDGIVITTEPVLELTSAELEDSGDYAVFVNVDGCNSRNSDILRINVNPRPSATLNSNSPVCAGERINLESNFIAGGIYNWEGSNFSSSLQNPTIAEADSSLHNGVYTLTIEKDGCVSEEVSTFVTINPSPTRPQLIGNTTICGSEAEALLRLNLSNNSVTNNARYIWSDPAGILDTTDNPNLDITDFTPYPDGNNMFSVRALLGECQSESSEAFIAVINKIPETQAFAGQDFSACETEEISLRGEAPVLGTGRWLLISEDTANQVIITNPSMANSIVNGLSGNESYTFRWTLSNGACVDYSSDEVTISINKVEDAFAGDDQIACAGTNIMLNAGEVGGNSFWTQPETQSLFGVRIADPTDPNSAITGLQPGNTYSFTWNVQGSCGDERDDVLILISDPNPFAGADIIACNDEGFAQLNASSPATGSVGIWRSVSPDVSISSDQAPNAVVTNLIPGIYQFIWELDNGTCGEASRDTVLVEYKQNPIVNDESYEVGFGEPIEIDVLANDIIPSGSQVLIIKPPEQGTLENLGNGRFRFLPSFNFVGIDNFLYEVCSDACECVMGEATFDIGRDAQCQIPSIITPNNDGVNDNFIIPCLFDQVAYPNSQLIIISRWGDEVYRSPTPYNNDWDGTFNGEPLPVGTYFYILDFGDGQTPENSFFMIQR